MKITILNNSNLLTNTYLNKSGIYQIINLINGKTYVGSSVNLKRRVNEYLNPLYISRNLKKGNSKILKALLKYGYINFEFKILEFIEFETSQSKSERRNLLLNKEQYYINEIKPEYNINQEAGNNLGRVYSEEVRRKMSLAKIGKPGNKKGAILSLESRALFREKSGMATGITMLDENNKILDKFESIQIASDITGISRSRISRSARNIRKEIIENGKVYKFKYSNEE